MSDQVFYITTPIFYINDVPHIGHAYPAVAADFIARFRRLQGRSVHFLTGTDEHGQKVARSAAERGLAPKEWADQIVPRWIEMFEALDISNDDFIRTTEERHERPVAAFVQALYDRDQIYLGTYEGLYCEGCEGFKQPDELVDGKCPLHDRVPEQIKEDNYFFRLSAYRERLLELYDSRTFILPETKRNEIAGKLQSDLEDLSVSRVSFDWGIPLPWDEKHVIYVWVDALQNYITAVGYGADEERFSRTWPADVHIIGKDILWFHTVIWPAMLMALDLPLPKVVFAHGFIEVGGKKMSKSLLTGISPHDLLADFGSDGFRYHFMREMSFGGDGQFSWESMAARYNSDLANDLGNLVSRVLSMITRYLGRAVPRPPKQSEQTASEVALHEAQEAAFRGMEGAVDAIAPHDALKQAWAFVRKANAYVEEVAPWHLAKDDAARRRLEVVLYELADALRLLALMLFPIMPKASTELWSRLGLPAAPDSTTFSESLVWGLLPAGGGVTTGAPLFPRIDEPSQ